MDWFTSDTHFGHANVIKYCSRPFANVYHMNSELIRRWNARVAPDDVVYHLGDFAFGSKAFIAGVRRSLNGRVVLVRGNHDRGAVAMLECGFDQVREVADYTDSTTGDSAILHHVPPGDHSRPHIKPLDSSIADKYRYVLCGHVHEKWARVGKAINVGVDVRNYEPQSFAELIR